MSDNASILAGAASDFATFLNNEGWVAEPREPHSPYAVKVAVGNAAGPLGHLVLYHSAKKGFTLVAQEVTRPEHQAPLQQAWDRFRGGRTAGDPHTGSKGMATSADPALPGAGDDVQATLFVDGSYVAGRGSYGYVVVRGSESVAEGKGDDVPSEWLQHHNVAGEMCAVIKALEYCAGQGWKTVAIAHDYEGLEAWATGRWRANKPATRAYQQAVRSSGIDVQWVKVKAHTGVLWNERADALAAGALATPSPAEQGASGRVAASPGDFLTGGFAQLSALTDDLMLSETLRRDYQANFDVLEGDRRLGSGSLYTDTKGVLTLVLHSNLPTATADRLRGLWEQRHTVREDAQEATDPLRRTRHVMEILGDYREDRVSMAPLRNAFIDDVQGVCATKRLSVSQEAALRGLCAGVATAPSFEAISAEVERADFIICGAAYSRAGDG